MKKNVFLLLTFLMVGFLSVGFAACSSDSDNNGGEDNNNELIGWWTTTPYEGWDGYMFCQALHFISNNVVDYYSYVANGEYWKEYSASFPGKSGWYYQDDCEGRYNYVIKDNILYLYKANDAKTFDFYNNAPKGYSKIK